MTEKEEAVRLAHAVLEKPYIDPDGDISVLARQFLRAREEIDAMRAALEPFASTSDFRGLSLTCTQADIRRARSALDNFTVPQVGTAKAADAERRR